jgi:hypothetical protein
LFLLLRLLVELLWINANFVCVFVSAQSFAAELATQGNVTRILIGGGYGLKGKSKMGVDFYMTPETHQEVFEVEILDERITCFAERAATAVGWEWDFFDLPGAKRPSPSVHMSVDSGLNVREDDFRSPPAGPVHDNDEDTAFGHRVILKGLKARPDLNGSTGRCGVWTDKDRYQVFVPEWEQGGPCNLAVKTANLSYASRISPTNVMKAIESTPSSRGSIFIPTPTVAASWRTGKDYRRSPLDLVCDDAEGDSSTMCMDTYHGPLSARADVMLNTVASKAGTQFAFLYIHPSQKGRVDTPKSRELREKCKLYQRFVETMRREDAARVSAWQAELLLRRDVDSWGEWVTLKVTIDGISPSVEREIWVSPDITMDRLHHQVLCPAVSPPYKLVRCLFGK